jgi:hypothetical protein
MTFNLPYSSIPTLLHRPLSQVVLVNIIETSEWYGAGRPWLDLSAMQE